MKIKTKSVFWEPIVALLIFVLILARLFSKEDTLEWVNYINFIGLILALWALICKICDRFKGTTQLNFIIGFSVVAMSSVVLVGGLFLAQILSFTPKTNDIILLITLFLTLPAQFYEELLVMFLR